MIVIPENVNICEVDMGQLRIRYSEEKIQRNLDKYARWKANNDKDIENDLRVFTKFIAKDKDINNPVSNFQTHKIEVATKSADRKSTVIFRQYENAIKPDWVKVSVYKSNNGKRVEVLSLPTKEDLDFLKDKEWCGDDIPYTNETKEKHVTNTWESL